LTVTDEHLQIDRAAATALASALRRVGYNEDSVVERLGDEGPAASDTDVPVFHRRLDDSPLANAIRLVLLELALPAEHAVDALSREGVDALVRSGLAREEDGRVVPTGRILPVEGLYIASDGFSRGGDDPPGYVATFTPTASWLAALTPRRHVARAVDVGTGSGAHALLAAQHADHVIATDTNPRALMYTAFNAAMNGLGNIETRLGSLFDPVEGEEFDLITCNAPYVVSPETRWEYRDSALPGDKLSEHVVRHAAATLADDGFAAVLVSWLAESESDPDVRLEQWLEGSGCDAWVLGLSGADVLDHAASWNEHLEHDQEAFGAALDRWTEYLASFGASWVTEGAVLLHRRAGPEHAFRVEPVDPDDLQEASAQVERAFAAHAFLADVHPDALLDTPFKLVSAVHVEQGVDEDGDAETRIVLDDGTVPEVVVDDDVADVLMRLDGEHTLGRLVERQAKRLELTKGATGDLRRESVEALRELLELGFFAL
jgi:hypothetical protein